MTYNTSTMHFATVYDACLLAFAKTSQEKAENQKFQDICNCI